MSLSIESLPEKSRRVTRGRVMKTEMCDHGRGDVHPVQPAGIECGKSIGASRLEAVLAPVVVGVPPSNAIRDLMLLPDGEIRHYGFRGDFRRGNIQNIYLASHDHGFSWIEHDCPPLSPGATVRSPWSGDYLTVLCKNGHGNLEEYQSIHSACPAPGLYLHRSTDGPDGPFQSRQIGDLLPMMLVPRQPLALRSRKRWILPAQGAPESGQQRAVVYYSDDDGIKWQRTILPVIPRPGLRWPHKGLRWENCGDEPTVAELSDGRLFMLIRTAQDEFWQSFSTDAGESWTTPEPSRFYGTITSPLLFTLSDGRLLSFWNNTTPLPEVDHALQPGLNEAERSGRYEDAFTNRDALHAAISEDDGLNWIGFRELHLNEHRNDIDFRSHGGNDVSLDKSIHQSQAVELPGSKVLLAFGQHPDCRRMIIFDPEWLYENGRSDDFRLGLGAWSHHQFLTSVPGNYRGFSGHCAVNRRAGVALVPHPDGEMSEVMRIARDPDVRLLEEKQGAVWNFPNATSGMVRLEIRQPAGSAGIQIALLDRWFNPTDPVVAAFSQFVLQLDSSGRLNRIPSLQPDRWHWLTIRWDLDHQPAAIFQVDNRPEHALGLATPTINGISYLHLQSAATESDPHGVLLKMVEMSGEVSREFHAESCKDRFKPCEQLSP